MTKNQTLQISSELVMMAKAFGADLVGFAAVEDLQNAPSFTFAPKMPTGSDAVDPSESCLDLKTGAVTWPAHAETIMVIAVHHPEDKPELDWWTGKKSPPGNKILVKTVEKLCTWIPERFGINTFHFPYQIDKGGTYLKDVAVLGALGTIGLNNLLITPTYGPQVRLRALALDRKLPSSGPLDFDPCSTCEEWCRQACPQSAFEQKIYSAEKYCQDILPGRTGAFSRRLCIQQMLQDENLARQEQKNTAPDEAAAIIKYCRQCELACPVGKTRSQQSTWSV